MDFISSGVACLGLPFRLGSEVINCLNSSKKSSRLLGNFILLFEFILVISITVTNALEVSYGLLWVLGLERYS
jgi:hypothetical protein